MSRRLLVAAALALWSMGTFAQTISVEPMAPDSATTVQVLANSYYGIEGESHVVFGDLIRIYFDEGTVDLAPNP